MFVGVRVASAFVDVRAGKEMLRDVRRHDRPAELLKGGLLQDLRTAETRLKRADEGLSGPLLAPVRVFPVLGRQVRSLASLSAAAGQLAGVGADGVARATLLMERPTASGSDRLALIREFGQIAMTTRQRLEGVSLGPREGLIAELAESRLDLAEDLSDLRRGLARATSSADAIAGLLAGPRRYLVFAGNNAEMRAGSGMFLTVGVLETAGGRFTLSDFRTVFDILLPPGAVPLEGDMADRWGWLHPNQDWRNLMLSPRFDASAALAAQMWTALGQDPVDGVIAVDPVALEQLLKALGPVTVDDLQIEAGNVVDELLHQQYLRYPDLEERPERREALGRIAHATMGALDEGGWSVADLVQGVVDAVRGRHIMAWSALPTEQEGWRNANADGTLGPDSLLLSVLNRGGNKLDRYLEVGADIRCAPAPPDTACTVEVDLQNVTPEGEPPYISGPHPGSGLDEGDYLGILTVNLPGAATGSRIDGVEQLAVAGADGPGRVVGFQLRLARHERRHVTVRFTLPGEHGALRVEPTARIPGVRFSSGSLTWNDNAARTLRW